MSIPLLIEPYEIKLDSAIQINGMIFYVCDIEFDLECSQILEIQIVARGCGEKVLKQV